MLPRQRLKLLLVLLAACGACFAATPSQARSDQPDILSLRNGIRIVFISIEGSSDIALITTLPMGLCGDEQNCAQWSHLIEHLVVSREGVQPFDEINAETLSDCMHLDYTRPAETWESGMTMTSGWLSNNNFDVESVQREIGRVIEEVNGLAAGGRTLKFANAAWAQAVRHGAEHVAINGDVTRATPDELASYFQRMFFNGPPPVLVVAGTFDREKIERVARESIEPIALPDAAAAKWSWVDAEDVSSRITWDLPTTHAVFAWRLPDDITLTELAHVHAAMPALSQLVSIPAAAYIGPGTYVLPEADVRVADRRYILLNMTLKDAAAATMRQATDDVRKAAVTLTNARGPSRAIGRINTVAQWKQIDDPAAVLKHGLAQGLPRRLIEGNIAVGASIREFKFGRSIPAMIVALEQGSDDAARAALGRVFTDENLVALLIAPEPAPQSE